MLAREQIAVLLLNTTWIILASILFSVLLFLPDQILELYRIIYSDEKPVDFLYLHFPVIIIGWSVWFAADQIVAQTQSGIANRTKVFEFAAVALPLLLGMLPMIGCAWGLLNAVPARLPTDQAATDLVGAIWGPMEKDFSELAVHLRIGAFAQIAAVVALVSSWRQAARMRKLAQRLHFGQLFGVGVALALIVSVTTAFYLVPVALPRLVGTFGIVALYAICILAFLINFTLLGMRHRFPFIALPVLLAILFSLDSINDNHAIRRLDQRDPAVLQAADAQTAKSQFVAWLDKRPDLQLYPNGYPVYVISAQGGGAYAAYQSAIFLARLQDVCPVFRHHVFAISSVSGGSVGAATFAAALNAYDHDLIELTQDEAERRAKPAGEFDPCPAITEFRNSARLPTDSDKPGPLERAVRRALKGDFLAPLIAATLFADFTQRFLPWPFPSLDRARPLEYALERAGQSLMKPTASAADVAAHNAFAGSILDLWRADGSMPALLVNATDAASGRRFVISPFRVAPESLSGKLGASLDYVFWDAGLPPSNRARDLRLSTAAFVSARFPWVTPAATIEDSRFSPQQSVRLVDGGYVDNSGVETALDLNEAIAGLVGAQKANGRPAPQLNLVVLSGGDFPVRKSFSFGEVMEPLRALLSTRSSRAYVAINKAGQEFQPYTIVNKYPFNKQMLNVQGETLKKARLDNRFYQLPLGWSLSEASRAIIEGQSGRYWECQPDDNFEQAQTGLAPSDCVEILIYHELNKSVGTVGPQVAIANFLIKEEERRSKAAGDENAIITCYRDRTGQTVNLEQAGNMRAVIQQWRDKNADREELLGYILGTAAFESAEFRTRRESLDYTSAEQILKSWGPTFEDIRKMPLAEIERLYVSNPMVLAEKVYGGRNGNGRGNGDGWKYRGRGLAFVTGKENYQKVARRLQIPELVDDPDLILIPKVNALSFIDGYFPASALPMLDNLVRNSDWKAARAKVQQNAMERPLHADEQAEAEKNSDRVLRKANLFSECIADAKIPKK